MEQREKELDSWDTLVKKTIDNLQPLSFFREMDQRFPRGNHLAYTTMAKSQALATWDPWDDPSPTLASSTWDPRALFAGPESSFEATSAFGPHSILLEFLTQWHGSQAGLKQLWFYPNVISTVRKDLGHITCFNCEQEGHYTIRFSKPEKKTRDSLDDLRVSNWD